MSKQLSDTIHDKISLQQQSLSSGDISLKEM